MPPRDPHRGSVHRDRASLPRLVTTVVVVGMLVACGAPDPSGGSSPSERATSTETTTPRPSASPSTEPTTPSSDAPEPTPTRGDITPTDGATALPPEVLPTPLPTPRPTAPGTSPQLREVVDAATLDLVTRLDVDPASIEVLVARPETFPDGAVGCPQPGQVYTQALVEGYRVVLVRADRAWLYTAAEGQPPELCASDAEDGGHGWVPPPGFDD